MRALTLYLVILNTIFSQQDRTTMGVSLQTQNGLDNNFSINNIDINLICENPKVSKIRNRIIKSLSALLSINRNLINLKGKTVEKLGIIGKEQAIACEVICSLSK